MRYKLTNIRTIDGDSIKATIHLGFGVSLSKASIRLSGIDTPETRSKNKTEKKAAKLVTVWLAARIKQGQDIYLHTSVKQRDKYGRPMGQLFIDGLNVCLGLVINRFAVSYSGKAKKKWKPEQLEYIINQLTKEQDQ